ncbi:MAG: NAD-dependent epimerase/dehydratase family protein [Sedimentitalea sp.]|uniref:NAD-dependent epimerase/dehydratase family protein n=1 Tax=Sedimentitalea sp. TaxID=2048915 RepID=UPI0032637AAF
MNSALIGATGFVGGNLARHGFSKHYASRNIAEVAGKSFDTVVCAAAPGSMFEANASPDRDKAQIDALASHLTSLKTDQFVLISSIAVLADFAGKDDETSTRFQQELAYGRHRRALEEVCSDHFDRCLIMRLPALFGPRLKKNFIFDILNPVPTMLTPDRMSEARELDSGAWADRLDSIYQWDSDVNMHRIDRAVLDATGDRAEMEKVLSEAGISAVGFTNPQSTYQYYNLDRLWDDAQNALAAEIDVLHLATEPLRADAIHLAVTGREMPESAAKIHHEDMRSCHTQLLRGETGPYLSSAEEVLEELCAFTTSAKDSRA